MGLAETCVQYRNVSVVVNVDKRLEDYRRDVIQVRVVKWSDTS